MPSFINDTKNTLKNIAIKTKLNSFFMKIILFRLNNLALIFVLFLFYLLKSYLFIIQNQYINGDIAIGLLMIDDMKNFEFYSWYFYGQYYFGNLYYVIVSILTFPFTINFELSVLVEGFFFFLSTIIINKFVKINFLLPTILFNAFIFWALPSTMQIVYFQGYSFILLVFIFSTYLLYKNFHTKHKIISAIYFGLIAGLSIWINASFIAIVGAYTITFIYKNYKNIKSNLHIVLIGFLSGVIGLIPFIIANLKTNGLALKWFTDGSSKNTGGMSKIQDIFFAFIDYSSHFIFILDQENSFFITKLEVDNLNNLLTFNFFISFIFGISILALSMFNLKEKNHRNSTFLVIVLILALISLFGGTRVVGYNLFKLHRYMMPVYCIVFLLAYNGIVEIFLKKEEYSKNIFLIILASFTILIGIPASINYIKKDVFIAIDRVNEKPLYEIITQDLEELNAKNVQCYNFFEVCAQVAFLSRNKDINVEILDQSSYLNGRNPKNYNLVKSNNLQEVLTVSKLTEQIPSDLIIKDYGFGTDRIVIYKGNIDISGLPVNVYEN